MLIWLLHSTKYAVCGLCGNCGGLGTSTLWKIQWYLKPKGFLLAGSATKATGDSFGCPLDKESYRFIFLIALPIMDAAWLACGDDPDFVEIADFVENRRLCGKCLFFSDFIVWAGSEQH